MTEAELLQAMLDAQPRAGAQYPNAFTTAEISELTGMALQTTQRRIRAMCREGKMEGMRDWRETSVGHMQRYPVFRLVSHPKV
mgnify:CR=1 FL=1